MDAPPESKGITLEIIVEVLEKAGYKCKHTELGDLVTT
jgi:hypothetical protein